MHAHDSTLQTHPAPDPPGSQFRARLMFTVALGFLLLLGLILPHGGSSEAISMAIWQTPPVRWILAGLWLVIVLESLPALLALHRIDRAIARQRALMVMLIPPLRLVVQPQASCPWVWLPLSGWQQRTPETFSALELRFALPMLFVAVLIIPVLIIELFFLHEIEIITPLSIGLHVITSFIWASFTFEFLLMFTVAEKRMQYAKDHWINIVIIILPLVAFLRALMLIRALRLARFSKAFQTVRMRVLLSRTQRILLLLNVVERVLKHFPATYLKTLRGREQRRLRELNQIRRRIRETELELARRAEKAELKQQPKRVPEES